MKKKVLLGCLLILSSCNRHTDQDLYLTNQIKGYYPYSKNVSAKYGYLEINKDQISFSKLKEKFLILKKYKQTDSVSFNEWFSQTGKPPINFYEIKHVKSPNQSGECSESAKWLAISRNGLENLSICFVTGKQLDVININTCSCGIYNLDKLYPDQSLKKEYK